MMEMEMQHRGWFCEALRRKDIEKIQGSMAMEGYWIWSFEKNDSGVEIEIPWSSTWTTQGYGAMSRSSNESLREESEEGNQIWEGSAVEREGESPHLQRSNLTMLKMEREKKSHFRPLSVRCFSK